MASSDSVPKVGGRRRLHDPGDLQPEFARVDPIEQPDARPEHDGGEVELRLRWHGIDRAGRTVTRETLELLRFADGRLIEHWGAELFRRES